MRYGIRLTSPRDGDGHGDTFSAFALALLIGHELSGKRKAVVKSLCHVVTSLGGGGMPLDHSFEASMGLEPDREIFQQQLNLKSAQVLNP